MSRPSSSRLLFTLLSLTLASFCHRSGFARTGWPVERPANLRASWQANQKLSKKEADALKEIDRLYQEALKLIQAGRYDAAMPLAEHALALSEKTFASKSPVVVANAANILGMVYQNKGEVAKAEPLYLRSIAIFEQHQGAMPDAGIFPLTNLAKLYLDKFDYEKAEPLYRRALAIKESKWGPEHTETAFALYYLARVYAGKNDAQQVESLSRRALKIFDKNFGAEHPNSALALEMLARTSLIKSDYAGAEALYQRVLLIREKAFGPEHFTVAHSLYDLANLYEVKGDYGRAKSLYSRALAIEEKASGREHPTLSRYLDALARFHVRDGDYSQAETYLRRSLVNKEKALGAESPALALTLDAIAYINAEKGDYVTSEQSYRRALSLVEKTLGADHFQCGFHLKNLGDLYLLTRDYGRAETALERALAIKERVAGKDHPELVSTLISLAIANELRGERPRAVGFMKRATEISEQNLALIVATGSEEQKRLYLAKLAGETDSALSLNAHSAPGDADAMRLALTTVLRRKGRALDAMTDQIGALRRRSDPQDRGLLDRLAEVNSRRAALKLQGPGQSDAAQFRTQVETLGAEAGQLEAQISARSAEFSARTQPVTIERVRRALPAGAALVEIMSHRTLNPRAKTEKELFGAARYVAYVLRREGEPTSVDLGEAAPIERACARFRAALSDPRRAEVKQVARSLDEMVMRPVRKLLDGARTVFISPDGALNLIPFGALVDEQQRYLVESLSITYLTSGRDLLRLQTQAHSRQGPVVIANPAFDQAVTTTNQPDQPASDARGRRSVNFAELKFSSLPGTAGEASAFKSILTDAQFLTEAGATEAALKQVTGPAILHIATHGFFLSDQHSEAADAEGLSFGGGQQRARGENPLLRSGLALAGANKRQSGGGEDGILTALEAAGLDLWGTKLVVLSACETGVGEATSGEGVYGLRRALVLAGAESQLMSLWQVSDAATRDLMVEYYKRLRANEERSEALRQVQLKLLKGGPQTRPAARRGPGAGKRGIGGGLGPMIQPNDRSHPFFWAGFIPVGDWRSLEAGASAQ